MSTADRTKWKFRPPPRGVVRESFRLCSVTGGGERCELGELCVEAHSQEELAEWEVRWGEDHRYQH